MQANSAAGRRRFQVTPPPSWTIAHRSWNMHPPQSWLTLAADVDLLLEFKKTIVKKDPLSVLASWAPNSRNDYCNWYGITCSRDASITWVDSILLASSQLEFIMWDGFATFRQLRFINFSDNSISGSIPTQLGHLTTLVSLDLSSNRLAGSLPSSFNVLSMLQTLVLGSNGLIGAVPNGLCRLTSLRILDMSYNSLTGLTADLNECKKLEVLNLEHNNIESDISQIPFSQLKSLRIINIGSNRFKGALTKELSRSNTITVMQLQDNAISGRIPGALGLLTMLTVLDLSSNLLNDLIPETIGNLALLEDLSLSQNMFTGIIPSSLGALTGLSRRLDLSQNKFIGMVPVALGSMKWVKSIDLSGNMLSGNLPPSLGGCESLLLLDLSRNHLSGSIPPTWINMASLMELNLSSNDLTGVIPSELGQITLLSTLDLSWNRLNGNIPGTLTNLKNLEMLDLSSNLLSGEVPDTPLFRSLGKSSFLNNSNLCGVVLNFSCSADSGGTDSRVKNVDLKTLLAQAPHILRYMGIAFLAIMLSFVLVLILFKLCYIEKYEALVDCLETRCSMVVVCLSCLHLTTWHPRIPLQTLQQATENFKDNNIVGFGTRSTIYKGFMTESLLWQGEKMVAVKRIKQTTSEIQKIVKQCRVLAKLNDQNVVKVLDWRATGEEIFILLDFYVNGDLENFLYNPNTVSRLEMLQRLQIAIDVAQEFGCTPFWVKAGRIAPECLTGQVLSKEAEVFSYGIFLLELITRKKPSTSGFALENSLSAWVQNRFCAKGIEIADPILLNTTYNYENLLSFIYLALSCSDQTQGNRPNVRDVVTTLQQLRNAEIEAMSFQR
ncbi:hypothetical protein GOP47_0005000 [Adiantum capillus-veneris]|uniref:Protein kinase domain-containing protein n=1 Tax=Adiantum capillus-veneris TaxID=13818 RepID=A0A9D4V561_ADICA|nr:hypothetical protein GOP47_0005000 [Adiantum capillus-veneris]